MTNVIRKPAKWEGSTFDDLFTILAGQAFVADQLGGSVDSVATFNSNRANADACSYDLFDDGSIWFHNNAQDEVWADAVDFVREMRFDGLYWDDCDTRDGLVINAMDRDLLVYLWGEEDAREFFESAGGIVPRVDVAS